MFFLLFTSCSLSFCFPSPLSSSSLHSFVFHYHLPLFSSSATMRMQLCAKDNYITACVRVWGNAGWLVRDRKKVERKLWKSKVLTFTTIHSLCSVSIGAFCAFHPFLHPYIELLGCEMRKNCSMQGNSLSCQTSEGQNQENEREEASERHGRKPS